MPGAGRDSGRRARRSGQWLRRRWVTLLMVLGVSMWGVAVPAREAPGGVYRLLPLGQWQARWAGPGGGDGAWPGQGAYGVVYVADVAPGQHYDLGLRLRAGLNTRLRVAVFDRPPWAPGARRYDLPLGPVVRTASPAVEYRWHLGISPHSKGRRLFITLSVAAGTSGQGHAVWHAIYLAPAPRRPMDSFGRGITYLAGPRTLVLAAGGDGSPWAARDPCAVPTLAPESCGPTNLVRNGDFRLGLAGWALIPGEDGRDAGRILVDEDGLVIRGANGRAQVGVTQILQRRVAVSRPLLLGLVLRLDGDGAAGAAAAPAPLRVSVCYLDRKDEAHCGERAYRRVFVTGKAGGGGAAAVRVPRGVWYEFEEDLHRAAEGLTVVTSLSITGGGAAGVTARVRDVWLRQP